MIQNGEQFDDLDFFHKIYFQKISLKGFFSCLKD